MEITIFTETVTIVIKIKQENYNNVIGCIRVERNSNLV